MGELTAEVAVATADHLAAHAAASKGEHAALQAEQIPNAYLDDTAEVIADRASFRRAFDTAAAGKHIKLAPVNNDVQAPQIGYSYLSDVADVTDAKAVFKAAFDAAAAGKHIVLAPVNYDV